MRCRSVCAEDTAPRRASASALTWLRRAAVSDGASSQRSIRASTAGAKIRIAIAAASAVIASTHVSHTGRNRTPAAASLPCTAMPAAGPTKAKANRTSAMTVTRKS